MSVVEPSWPDRPLRVALCSGGLFRHDAISYSLQLKLDILRELHAAGAPVEATAFVQYSDVVADDVVVVPDVAALMGRPEFWCADVHVFEFGIYYGLFDSVFLLDPTRVVAVYHNVTPPELVADPEVRTAIEQSLLQKHNLAHVRHVICDSEFNQQDLVACGIPVESTSVLHLPAARTPLPRAERAPDAPVEFVFLGRLVQAKGINDLLAAARALVDGGVDGFHLTLVGSPAFAEAELVARLVDEQADHLAYLGERSDAEIAALMARADVLVMPSYHEGYCLPVIEAFEAGCQVIAYDAANLPHVVGGLGQLVPTGQVAALGAAMQRTIETIRAGRRKGIDPDVVVGQGSLPAAKWRQDVARHLERYGRDAYRDGLLAVLADVAGVGGRVLTGGVA